ncbi:MAG: 4Fe-4S dicluster domain-containing protein, partial [Deltaproteobacteria bacterium]|nr:4Fe-4S dicluster domain-containing protein [Deltaproteobacteria bacterium]
IERGEYPHARNVPVPIVCNQCDKPACTRVCPVQATYSLDNGIVYIDPHRCIGCGYCMAACPYAVRFISPVRKVAEKCDWCWPRVREGHGPPACAQACPTGVLIFGDLNDPESEISKLLARESTAVLKPESGNEPQVFYIGLDEAYRLVRPEE